MKIIIIRNNVDGIYRLYEVIGSPNLGEMNHYITCVSSEEAARKKKKEILQNGIETIIDDGE